MDRLAIIVPCYNEEESLFKTNIELNALLDNLIKLRKISRNSYILYVDDGSHDKTWSIIESLNKKNKSVKGIKFASNSGHQNAVFAGLMYAKENADMTVSIDADLQDDVNAIEQMVDKYLDGAQIVYGVRNDRTSDSVFKRLSASIFYNLIKSNDSDNIYNSADFRLMSSKVLEELSLYDEYHLYLRGISPKLGYKQDVVYYARKKRENGESKYTLTKMIKLAMDGITSANSAPLFFLFPFSFCLLFVSLLLLIQVIRLLVITGKISFSFTLLFIMFLFGGVLFLSLAILGQYIGRTFIQTKNRPRYYIEKKIGKE